MKITERDVAILRCDVCGNNGTLVKRNSWGYHSCHICKTGYHATTVKQMIVDSATTLLLNVSAQGSIDFDNLTPEHYNDDGWLIKNPLVDFECDTPLTSIFKQ